MRKAEEHFIHQIQALLNCPGKNQCIKTGCVCFDKNGRGCRAKSVLNAFNTYILMKTAQGIVIEATEIPKEEITKEIVIKEKDIDS